MDLPLFLTGSANFFSIYTCTLYMIVDEISFHFSPYTLEA